MNFLKSSNMSTGLVAGIGLCLLAPVAAKVLTGAGRPLLKETLKGGMFLYTRGRTMLAESRESLEDITAEAKAELAQSKQLPSSHEAKTEVASAHSASSSKKEKSTSSKS